MTTSTRLRPGWTPIGLVLSGLLSVPLLLATPTFAADPPASDVPTTSAAAEDEIVVFIAHKIVTMEPGLPEATAVAVRNGQILDVGSLEAFAPWIEDLPHRVDRRFEKKVLLPGFIDPHVHPFLAGKLLTFDIVAPEQWVLPDRVVPATLDRETFTERITALHRAHPPSPVPHVIWGWHPLWHGEWTRADLDAIAPDTPLVLWHRSYHEIVANSRALEWMDLSPEDAEPFRGQVDLEKGHFAELGMDLVNRKLAPMTETPEKIAEGMALFRTLVRRGGVTTVADLIAGSTIGIEQEWNAAKTYLQGDDVPFRTLFIAAPFAWQHVLGNEADVRLEAIRAESTEQLIWPRAVKSASDGAFISQLMQLSPPGYLDGHEGEWLLPPQYQRVAIERYWRQDFDVYYHVNGDRGLDVALDVFEELEREYPRLDPRFSLEHFGVSREDQVARIKALGASVSINGYYLYSFGDAYAKHGLGYARASQMTRLGSLARAGIPFTMHSDCPMGPIEPLLAITTAVTRRTSSGAVLGPEQAVSVDAALRAVTIDAAWSLRLDREVGSIAVGKRADFVVLDKSPFEVRPDRIREIEIWGTVYGGTVFEAP